MSALPAPLARQHPVVLAVASLPSASSRKVVLCRLHSAAAALSAERLDAWGIAWERLTIEDLLALRTALLDQYAIRTARAMWSAVRSVLRACADLGQLEEGRLARLLRVPGPKGSPAPVGRHVSRDEERRLLDAGSTMERALLRLMLTTGARVSEVCALDLADVEGDAVRIVGKANRERIAPLGPRAARAIADWLRERGDEPGPLFVRSGGRRLTRDAVAHLLDRLCARAGVERLRPHDLRRTVVGNLLEAGTDVSTAMQVTGHADAKTFLGYDRRGAARVREAVAALEA